MSTARDIVIGVDMGTTATKAVAYSVTGELAASASHGYPLEEPFPGHAVQDPDLILGAVYEAVREVVTEIGTSCSVCSRRVAVTMIVWSSRAVAPRTCC